MQVSAMEADRSAGQLDASYLPSHLYWRLDDNLAKYFRWQGEQEPCLR
jgi:hypothetical protein